MSRSLLNSAIPNIVKSIKSLSRNKKSKKSNKNVQKQTRIPRSIGPKQAAPAAMSRVFTKQNPHITSGGDGIYTIRHRELVGVVSSSVNWTQQIKLGINPANPDLFLWLSGIATRYIKYRFRKLRFEYIPRCATSDKGSIEMAVDYNAANGDPASELVLAAYPLYSDGVSWQESTCETDCKLMNEGMEWKLVRTSQPAFSQIVNFDGGNFFLYTNGGAAQTEGKLFVSYEVDFKGAALPANPLVTAEILAAVSPTRLQPFGQAPNNLGSNYITYDPLSGVNVLTLPYAGVYIYAMSVVGTVIIGGISTTAVGANDTVHVPISTTIDAGALNAKSYGYIQALKDGAQVGITYINAGTISAAAMILSPVEFVPL